MKNIKDKIYNWLVRKNGRVWYEYERYVREHMEEHRIHRLRHLRILLKLNWFYRVKKNTTPYLYWDVPVKPESTDKIRNMPKKETPSVKKQVIPAEAKKVVNSPQRAIPVSKPEMAEYLRCKRQTAYAFAMGVKDYDVISFDVFDTLILRKLAEPEHIFMLVGEKLNVYNFINIRRRAEKEVREEHVLLRANRECTIYEIYQKISEWTGICCEEAVRIEIETELEFCVENPYMKQVFQIVQGMGKTVYAVSNMYLSKAILKTILNKCGYFGFKDIIVSCDYSCSKINGALFDVLKINEPEKKIVHIGDNRIADIKGAQLASVDSRLYPACRERGNENRARGFSSLIGSAYYAMVNNRLHSGVVAKECYSLGWEFGYLYGGLTALGYVNWIHKKAKEEGKEIVVFLSRDGAVLKKIYDELYDDIPSCYMLWSRICGMRDISVGTREQIIFRVLDENLDSGMTIRDALMMMGWENSLDIFIQNNCCLDLLLRKENVWLVKNIIIDNWEQIVSNSNDMIMNEEEYIVNCLESKKKIALIDIGWTGKNDLKLKAIIEKCIENSNVGIYMLGSVNKVQNPMDIKNNVIQCYMFASDYNREIHDAFCQMSTFALDVVEKMFSAASCSFVGITAEGKFEFAAPEIENYKCYKELSSGIYDFCLEYYNEYGKYNTLMNITGYDAWCALRKGMNSKKMLEKIFESTVYTKGIKTTEKRNKTLDLIGR